jgi:phosphoribosylamine--glycine ligase
MRVLGIGDSCDLGAMYLRLAAEGHEVRVCVRDEASADVFRGLVSRAGHWESELSWARDGLIVFEGVGDGALQDSLRAEGYRVIGGSAFGDALERDRDFGQRALREAGLQTAAVHEFSDFGAGIAFAEKAGRQLVFKLNGHALASWRNFVGRAPDGSDLVGYLEATARRWTFHERPSFVLMDYVSGVEMGVGAYFNGERFLRPACLDWEHKHFFPGDLGELTGEMGTLVTYSDTEPFFARTLLKLEPALRAHGHRGYVNLNTIVNERGIWPLELTCRFGYPGFAILSALQPEGWGALLTSMADPASQRFAAHPGFAVGVVLTVPPFPYRYGYAETSLGQLIMHPKAVAADLHYAEVGLDERGELVAAGGIGYLMVATGRGSTVEAARASAYAVAGQVVTPNLRYRNDIGSRFIARDRALLEAWGQLPSPAR